VASLQARSPLRSAHPLLFVNKAVSLTAFIVLLGAGWVALSYLKSDLPDRWQSGGPRSAAASVTVPVEQTGSESKRATAVRLVYSCVEDRDYYHASTHLSSRCERTALSEEAALGRGLKRCKKCFPDLGD
jgi:hypothetical protein